MGWTQEEEAKLKKEYSKKDNKELVDEMDKTEQAIVCKASRMGVEKESYHYLKKEMREIEAPEFDDEELNWFISGFVAGEGCFSITEQTNSDTLKFRFGIAMSDRDAEVLEKIRDYFGTGEIHYRDARKEHWDDKVIYQIQNMPELAKVVIPFFDQYGFKDSHKQKQYNEWREKLVEQYELDI